MLLDSSLTNVGTPLSEAFPLAIKSEDSKFSHHIVNGHFTNPLSEWGEFCVFVFENKTREREREREGGKYFQENLPVNPSALTWVTPIPLIV